MTDFSQLLQQGGTHAWIYLPTAVLLGALALHFGSQWNAESTELWFQPR